MSTVAEPPHAQLRVLTDGVDQVLPGGELERKLDAIDRGERGPLRVKFGMDPTSPDVHVGHTVVLRKLREFQSFGHTAVLIIGGFTAQVGDPSGRSAARPRLSPEEVRANAATYLEQVRRVLLPEPLEVVDNTDWLGGLDMGDVLRLASQATVAQMLERSDFAARYEAGRPIAVSEFLYPLLQGHDSVEVRAGVELGGTDQTFNLLVGRQLQAVAGQDPQTVVTLPLLEGLDGSEKMSKTSGNTIGVDEEPAEMFGKAMRVRDELMVKYLRLVTDLHPDEVDALAAGLQDGSVHPAEAKRRLAREIVRLYHGTEAVGAAERRFDVQFREHGVPDDVPEFALGAAPQWFLPTLLQETGLAASGSEARRLVLQGAVRLDGQRLVDPTAELEREALAGRVLQVGKRRFARLLDA
ncbi:tyrosine--tRNA ligase [Egibacter rhizosphaerae]|uniref:Tyrosine--tRNA ligase n=1 Tax=Egibacter rhizosphaerae TaxID=1670831 RepID=A0A411YK45_9ACTN|nr:tyrosine--tRNA ligase [Egibacter rhizosphaerae]QBI21578.1 tyrosine--tRNA ligase [Egibacter rhizosphaerae]